MKTISQTILYSSFEEYQSHRETMIAAGYVPYTVNRIAKTGEIKCTWKLCN